MLQKLQSLDPDLNELVIRRIKEVARRTGRSSVSISDLTDAEKLEILEDYSSALYRRYRLLRTDFLETMHGASKRETLKDRVN